MKMKVTVHSEGEDYVICTWAIGVTYNRESKVLRVYQGEGKSAITLSLGKGDAFTVMPASL